MWVVTRLVQDTGTGTRFISIPISTIGGWHPDAHVFMCSLADAVASHAVVERRVAIATLPPRRCAFGANKW